MSKLVQIDDILPFAPNEQCLSRLAGRRPRLEVAIQKPRRVNLKLNGASGIFSTVEQRRKNRKVYGLATVFMEIFEYYLPL